MKTVKINVSLSIGFVGAEHKDVLDVEIPDNATEEQSEQLKEDAAKDWGWGYIDLGWSDYKSKK
jgi:hypothetical protein